MNDLLKPFDESNYNIFIAKFEMFSTVIIFIFQSFIRHLFRVITMLIPYHIRKRICKISVQLLCGKTGEFVCSVL